MKEINRLPDPATPEEYGPVAVGQMELDTQFDCLFNPADIVGRRGFGDSVFPAVRDRVTTERQFQRSDDRRNSPGVDLWHHMQVGFSEMSQAHY
jgi:hypothetical protein